MQELKSTIQGRLEVVFIGIYKLCKMHKAMFL